MASGPPARYFYAILSRSILDLCDIISTPCDIIPILCDIPKLLLYLVTFLQTFAREYVQHVVNGDHQLPPFDGTNYPRQIPLDTIHIGQSRTRSANSWVTDSAAGATAFSCARKSYNGAIAVNSTQGPCSTVLEAAKYHGYHTGLVVTSRITHATPAAFSSHVTWRDYEREIAVQQIGHTPLGRTVDLMFGGTFPGDDRDLAHQACFLSGGRMFFMPNTTSGSRRKDGRDLEQEARKQFQFKKTINARSQFDELKGQRAQDLLPLMGLFALDHMSFEIDRDPSLEPSLREMAEEALRLLTDATKHEEKGFFLMIEGSRIDMAAHNNDPAAHVHDILAYQQTVALVKQYVEEHPGTVMISVRPCVIEGCISHADRSLTMKPEASPWDANSALPTPTTPGLRKC